MRNKDLPRTCHSSFAQKRARIPALPVCVFPLLSSATLLSEWFSSVSSPWRVLRPWIHTCATSIGPSCAEKTGVAYGPIQSCIDGPLGNQYQHEFAVQTENLNPPHKYVPWVVVNGVFNETVQDEITVCFPPSFWLGVSRPFSASGNPPMSLSVPLILPAQSSCCEDICAVLCAQDNVIKYVCKQIEPANRPAVCQRRLYSDSEVPAIHPDTLS